MERPKSDYQVQRDVLGELTWDTLVHETEVGVEVDGGIVTLTGTVSSWTKKQAAVAAAHRVAGVRDVADDIAVASPDGPRSDTDIARAVRRALGLDVVVPEAKIQSTVAQGVVTLTGQVTSGGQRDAAVRAVRNHGGVVAVRDGLRIEPPIVAPDAERTSIE
jgi:osmotically-inducible protein OsmY